MPQIGQRPHNPVIAPGPILLGHANNQFLNFSVDPWPARGSPFLRAIELAGDEPSVPCQDGVRQGGSRHLAECLATQSTANLAKLRSLRVRKLQPPLQLAPQDPVFSSQILIPQQQLMVHRPRNVGQDTCPLHESPPICPPIREGALDRPKKPSGRHAARLRRDGITARLSCSFNFLATRSTFECGGPRVYSYKELLRAVAHEAGLKPMLIPIPFAAWHALAWFSEMLPNPPVTRNQVELMQVDNVSSPEMPGFGELGISPHAVEEILQEMLWDH